MEYMIEFIVKLYRVGYICGRVKGMNVPNYYYIDAAHSSVTSYGTFHFAQYTFIWSRLPDPDAMKLMNSRREPC
jgi:hypothetical protein